MTIWIVGSNGMLAKSLASACKKNNIAYIASNRKEVDITSFPQVEAFAKQNSFSLIVNCAAYTNVEKAEEEGEKAFLLNVKGPLHLASIANQYQVKIIHISTDYVFSGEKNTPYKEEDIPKPVNVYGYTKLLGEKEIQKTLSNHLIIRTAWLFGPSETNFVEKIVQKIKMEKEISIVNDQIGSPTNTDDLAEAILLLQNENGLLHVANRRSASWYEFGRRIVSKYHTIFPIKNFPEIFPISSNSILLEAKRPRYSVLDTTKAESVMKKKLDSWEEALQRYFKSRV